MLAALASTHTRQIGSIEVPYRQHLSSEASRCFRVEDNQRFDPAEQGSSPRSRGNDLCWAYLWRASVFVRSLRRPVILTLGVKVV